MLNSSYPCEYIVDKEIHSNILWIPVVNKLKDNVIVKFCQTSLVHDVLSRTSPCALLSAWQNFRCSMCGFFASMEVTQSFRNGKLSWLGNLNTRARLPQILLEKFLKPLDTQQLGKGVFNLELHVSKHGITKSGAETGRLSSCSLAVGKSSSKALRKNLKNLTWILSWLGAFNQGVRGACAKNRSSHCQGSWGSLRTIMAGADPISR